MPSTGNPSTLLVRDHGHVAGSISSERGVKQGCVLGSLGFATVMQPVYHKCLGGLVGIDDQAAVAWLEAKPTMQTPVTRALRDFRFPSLLALQLANISNIPRPIYLLRAMPLRVTLAPIIAFDQRNRHALLPRLLRSSNPLPSPRYTVNGLFQEGHLGIDHLLGHIKNSSLSAYS